KMVVDRPGIVAVVGWKVAAPGKLIVLHVFIGGGTGITWIPSATGAVGGGKKLHQTCRGRREGRRGNESVGENARGRSGTTWSEVRFSRGHGIAKTGAKRRCKVAGE